MRIKPYKLKNGKTLYKVQGYLGIDPLTGKKVQVTKQGFKTKKEAESAFRKLMYDFDEGRYKAADTKITYRELYDTWVKIYKNTVKESTYNVATGVFKNRILPVFGDLKIEKIRPTYCQDFANSLQDLVTGRAIYSRAAAPMVYAYKMEMIDSNPFDRVIFPKFKTTDAKNDFLSREEVAQFLDAIDNYQHYVYFRTLIYTGLRKSEALALQWGDIDFKNRSLSVNRTLATGTKNKILIQPPKTRASKRTILLDADSLKDFNQLKKTAQSFWIFSNGAYHHYHPATPRDWIRKYLGKARLRKIKVHDLRRTHASLLFGSGANIKAVQERLGHGDMKTTMNIYVQVTTTSREETVDNFVEYLKSV